MRIFECQKKESFRICLEMLLQRTQIIMYVKGNVAQSNCSCLGIYPTTQHCNQHCNLQQYQLSNLTKWWSNCDDCQQAEIRRECGNTVRPQSQRCNDEKTTGQEKTSCKLICNPIVPVFQSFFVLYQGTTRCNYDFYDFINNTTFFVTYGITPFHQFYAISSIQIFVCPLFGA